VSIRIGPLPDSSLVVTRVGSVRVVACASPDYLAARGLPLTPADLVRHDCITIDEAGVLRSWAFMEGDRKSPRRSGQD
jgi:DNA-binding transcriptional LysR family regulator